MNIGIDLGTTNSALAYIDPREAGEADYPPIHVLDVPQVVAEGLVTTMQHPTLGSYRGIRHPIKYSRTPGATPRSAPTYGQHSQSVLRDAGYSAAEIDGLLASAAVQ